MRRPVIAALVLVSAVGAARMSAQVQPPATRFVPPRFLLQIRPPQPDTSRPRLLRLPPSATLLCPMPVAVPDTATLERMPTAHADPHDSMPVARPGCTNPLGPQAHRQRVPGKPPQP